MSSRQESEDVKGLFRKFGGDVTRYKTFEQIPRFDRKATPPALSPLAVAIPAPPSEPLTNGPRELDLLFSRLAGTSQTTPEAQHRLMSRWRKPS